MAFNNFFFDFDGYYIVRNDEGQPRPKCISNKCGTNIYFFTLQRFGPSPSPFKCYILLVILANGHEDGLDSGYWIVDSGEWIMDSGS